MTHYCTACGHPCEIDDGSVEPELMRHAIRQPFAPASCCCGAEVAASVPDMVEDLNVEINRLSKAVRERDEEIGRLRDAMGRAVMILRNDLYATRIKNAIAELEEHLTGDENEGGQA